MPKPPRRRRPDACNREVFRRCCELHVACGLLNKRDDDGRYTVPEVWDRVVIEHEEEVPVEVPVLREVVIAPRLLDKKVLLRNMKDSALDGVRGVAMAFSGDECESGCGGRWPRSPSPMAAAVLAAPRLTSRLMAAASALTTSSRLWWRHWLPRSPSPASWRRHRRPPPDSWRGSSANPPSPPTRRRT